LFMYWNYIEDFEEFSAGYRDVVIETMLCVRGELPLWQWHRQRFAQTLAALDWGAVPPGLWEAVETAVKRPDGRKARRVRWLTGKKRDGIDWSLQFLELLPRPAGIVLTRTACIPETERAGMLKSRNNLQAVRELRQPGSMGAGTDILLCDAGGYCLETTVANIFIIRENRIITPPLRHNMVPGVMRRYLLEKQSRNNYEIIEKNIHFARDLLPADGVFVTNAVSGIMPVSRVLEKPLDTTLAEAFKLIIDTELKIGNTIWR